MQKKSQSANELGSTIVVVILLLIGLAAFVFYKKSAQPLKNIKVEQNEEEIFRQDELSEDDEEANSDSADTGSLIDPKGPKAVIGELQMILKSIGPEKIDSYEMNWNDQGKKNIQLIGPALQIYFAKRDEESVNLAKDIDSYFLGKGFTFDQDNAADGGGSSLTGFIIDGVVCHNRYTSQINENTEDMGGPVMITVSCARLE